MNDRLEVPALVAAALESAGVTYSIGGSLVSSVSGEPGASIDADMIVDLAADEIQPFLAALGPEFDADAQALEQAAGARVSATLRHRPSGTDVILLVASSPLDLLQLQRRWPVVVSTDPKCVLYFHAPEDVLLQKLQAFQSDDAAANDHWRDALTVIRLQGPRLDRSYLTRTASMLGLSDLLARALGEASESQLANTQSQLPNSPITQ